MASLNKLAIRGIRSFDDKQISVIEFFSPVTVIVGHNGSGKTTIIECLKYATTGDQPPNTRGGAFVHDPKMANEKEVKAQVKLRFHAANGSRMLAVRNLSVTMKKTAGMTMKTLESILALADGNADKGGKRGVISTKCAEMDAEIPTLLGVSKAVLENVIFCHQEDSYWPLAEPAALKKKFDDIFEATRYTKALDSIKTLRKDRLAELKAEKERLDSLSREKQHADKLRSRIADLNSTIATKEIVYEETKQELDELVASNARFYEYSTKFREIYLKIQNLEERKERYKQDLENAKETTREVQGTDAELETRLRNFDQHIGEQKQKKRTEQSKRDDLEEDIARARKAHEESLTHHGQLQAEAIAQDAKISEREQLISEISTQNNIKGYDYAPLEREKIIEFIARLNELQKKQRSVFEKLQNDSRAKSEDYNKKARQLSNELEGLKMQKSNTREQLSIAQRSLTDAEHKLDATETLSSELHTLTGDIEEKKARLQKVKNDFQASKYESKLAEKVTKARNFEDRRDELNEEISSLTLQSDSRARLDLRRAELKTKTADVKNTLEAVNDKFRKLAGSDACANTMEDELDRVLADTERHHLELESQAAAANKNLQQAETTLSNFKSQLKAKREELKGYEKKLKAALDDDLEDAIKEATTELNIRKEDSGNMAGMSQIYEKLLSVGKSKKTCTVCNRHLNDQEMVVFEKFLNEEMKRSSPEKVAENVEEMKQWQDELDRLQKLMPTRASQTRLKDIELPALEKQIKEQEAVIPSLSERAEEASDNLNELKKQLKNISSMRQHAIQISRTQKEAERLKEEISNLETQLKATGSTKTTDEVKVELDVLSGEIRVNDREKQALITERERQTNAQRNYENDLHAMELRENNLKNQIREKDNLEASVLRLKQDIDSSQARLKELDTKIADAQPPIDRLEQEHQQVQAELNNKIAEAQRLSQDLNMSVDRLDNLNKMVERYVRNKGAKALKDCAENLAQYTSDIEALTVSIESVRGVIAEIDKEIHESGASMANLRENIRIRHLIRDIAATQEEIDSHDMEEAAKARRNFDQQYKVKKAEESNLQSKYAHTGGELSSHKSQLKTWEEDLGEFKDINKRYTDQLIKVKMSDMANSDLEKYAKALDNAIMKYHGLKMEEVNDTMRHLWNKTYQGTDIDGIKIRSDVEGGASKRSYNYRVVMTKDQVEMDMRGRCSAGQKMLASIIIRLALSDSFGQNCGILALDEPTNALDTENIDALAASLVDIINERKNHSNFQLIIITHDENFLRKLGQSDVMEYYWRVSRDSRQKSVIERQRFR